MAVAYNPNDSLQSSFLGALKLGETGNSPNAYSLGYGGADLSSFGEVSNAGFPEWAGVGNTHAAGAYQFQPGTWSAIASKYGLNFQNPQDQDAGAWYEAQDVYQQKTGGDLSTALANGDYSSIQQALAGTWPSVLGNLASPGGLAANLSSGIGAATAGPSLASDPSANGGASSSSHFGIVNTIENWFERFGLILIGGIIIIAALWALLSSGGYVPSPKQLIKSAI